MLKLKSWRDSTSDQRPLSLALCGLPGVRRNYELWSLSFEQRRPEAMRLHLTRRRRDQEGERRARVVVPNFSSIHLMIMRALARFQKKIDGRTRAARARFPLVPIGLAVVPAFRMLLERKERDDFLRAGFTRRAAFARRGRRFARCDPRLTHAGTCMEEQCKVPRPMTKSRA